MADCCADSSFYKVATLCQDPKTQTGWPAAHCGESLLRPVWAYVCRSGVSEKKAFLTCISNTNGTTISSLVLVVLRVGMVEGHCCSPTRYLPRHTHSVTCALSFVMRPSRDGFIWPIICVLSDTMAWDMQASSRPPLPLPTQTNFSHKRSRTVHKLTHRWPFPLS